MNAASLIDKIRKLIVEADDDGGNPTLAAMYGDSDGGISLRKNPNMARASGRDEYVPDSEQAIEAEQQFLANKMFANSILSKMVKEGGRNGKVERLVFSYRGDEDKRDWQSTILAYHNDKIDGSIDFWLTPQTREFLHRLIGELTAPVETKIGKDKTETAPKISNLDISAKEIKSAGGYDLQTMKNIYRFLKPDVQTSVLKLFTLVSELDSRFRPSSYEIKLTAPLAKRYDDETLGTISKNIDSLDQSAMPNRNDDVAWLNTVRSCINDSNVDVKISIQRDVTLMPLYDSVNYTPIGSKVGALNKLAWTYQKMREMNKTMFSKFVRGLESEIEQKNEELKSKKDDVKLADEVIDLESRLEQIKKNGMDYVNGNFIYGENEGDVLNFGPMALMYKSMQIRDQNAAIAITCDSGRCYLYRHVKTENGDEEQCIKFNSSTPYGEILKNYFEGLITLPEFFRSCSDMESSFDAKSKQLSDYINNEFLNKSDPVKIYCLKMMFCDWVNLEYQMNLPDSVFDSPSGRAGLRSVPMPPTVSVPGSQQFQRKITKLEQTMEGNKLKTTIDNVLSKGSGSLSFLKRASKFEFNGYKLRDNFVDISLLNDFVIGTIKGFYAIVNGSQFNDLKNDVSVTVDDVILDPTANEALKKFLSTQTMLKTKSIQFILKCDRENYDRAMENLDFCTDMISQLCNKIERGVWSMSNAARERLSSSIRFFNAQKAGSPVNISKLERGMVSSIHGAENHLIARSNCIVDLNRVNDLGPMISAYFMSIQKQLADSEEENAPELFEPQTLVHSPSTGLNMAKTTRRAGSGARQTYVDELYDYMTTSSDNINHVFSESFIEGTKSNNESIVECLGKMFDAVKTLTKLTVIDGVRMLEYSNLTDIEKVEPGTLSVLSTGISATAFGFDAKAAESFKSGIELAKKKTLPSNLNVGFIVDPYCSTYLKPVIRLVKSALQNVDPRHKKPVLITDQDCDLPYVPVHTAMFATADEKTNELQINLYSSCLVMNNSIHNHDYSYVTKLGVITNDSPTSEERDEVYSKMMQSDFAYAVLGVSSKKYMVMNALNSIRSAFSSARKSYDQIVSAINGNSSLLSENDWVSKLMKLPVTENNDLNETISDDMQNIMKFFMILYVLMHDTDEDLA